MTVENVYAPASFDGSEGLLATLIFGSYRPNQSQFFTGDAEPLQVGYLVFPPGHRITPHVHRSNPRKVERTQEVLIIRKGKIHLTLYTSAGEPVRSYALGPDDVAVLLSGGHSLEVMSADGAELLEVKSGPYAGSRELDKYDLRVGG